MSRSAIAPSRAAVGISAAVTALFLAFCVCVPLGAVVARVSGSWGAFALKEPPILSTAKTTFLQALWSTVFAAGVGIPLGLAASRLRGRFAAWVDGLLLLPAGVPTVVAAAAWVTWLGRSGWLARLGIRADLAYSLKAVILAHVFYNAPWIALMTASARRSLPPQLLEAASTLGAGPLARFRLITWPHIRPAVAAACAQVLALCSMSFALVLILGGGPPVEALETSLYAKLRFGSVDLAGAAACAVWELLITLTPWIVVLALQARKGTSAAPATVPGFGARRSGLAGLGVLAFALLLAAPYSAVTIGSDLWSAWARADFWMEVSRPLRLSLEIAALTAGSVLALVSAALIALEGLRGSRLRNAVAAALALPSGISVLVLGLGAWLAYGRWIDPFSGSLPAIVGLQATVFFPLAFRMLWPLSEARQRERMEAAVTLGASPWQAFWLVDWPRWRGLVLSAFGLVSAAALGEVAAVSLFYSEELIPLPLLVSRWMGQYRFEEARAVAALLFLMAASVTVLAAFSTRGAEMPEKGRA